MSGITNEKTRLTQKIPAVYDLKNGFDPFEQLFSDNTLSNGHSRGNSTNPIKASVGLALVEQIELSDENLQTFAERHGKVLRAGVKDGFNKLVESWKNEFDFSYKEAREAVKQLFGDGATDSDVIFILKIATLVKPNQTVNNPGDVKFTKLVEFALTGK
jgi:hypothetical protein